MTRRSLIGVAAVLLGVSMLGWRIRAIVRTPRVAVSTRVAQLMDNRLLALKIEAYAKRYGRPAYFLDSVVAHLDSADAAVFRRNLTDLWGDPVSYQWTWCDFTLVSWTGMRGRLLSVPASDSIRRAMALRGRMGFPAVIDERYPWPAGVGRTQNCFAGS
jgi:hypothetical protein